MLPDLPVPAAGRTVQLLELLLNYPQGITSQECIDQLEITRSSLFSLLRTLKILGYVEQNNKRGVYRPGPRLLAWRGSASSDPQDLLTAFYQETSARSQVETIALVVSNHPELLVLAQVESAQRVRSAFETGQRLSPGETAAGAVLNAKPTNAIRKLGYHLFELHDSVELALPICDDGHNPNGALLLSAPASRYQNNDILDHLPELREMAARLSYRLGAPLYAPYQGTAQPRLGPTTSLSIDEIAAFLSGPWAASLACIRPDGTPHVVPVWHEWDGTGFNVAAWGGSRWAEYLLENARVSITVDEPWPPLRRVYAEGNALPLLEADIPGGTAAILDRLSRRFLGRPLNPNRASLSWSAFRITPEKITGWRGLRTNPA
jgi:DNA-binding IclR family transcriptional regulator